MSTNHSDQTAGHIIKINSRNCSHTAIMISTKILQDMFVYSNWILKDLLTYVVQIKKTIGKTEMKRLHVKH